MLYFNQKWVHILAQHTQTNNSHFHIFLFQVDQNNKIFECINYATLNLLNSKENLPNNLFFSHF